MAKILIIGGNSGIGAATADALRAKYPEAKQYIPDKYELDVTDTQTIDRILGSCGPFTHIVYSAGVNELAWVNDPKISFLMEEIIDTNCTGFVNSISRHITIFPDVPLSAVAVSSDAGRIPMRGSVAYCASKAALNMAVKVMARELAPLHRINAVAPGMVEGTAMTEYIDATIPGFRDWTPNYARMHEQTGTPTKRRATLPEVAETISWVLFGPNQMTGAIIDITGGR